MAAPTWADLFERAEEWRPITADDVTSALADRRAQR